MPAQAGIHDFLSRTDRLVKTWMPACAGMTVRGRGYAPA